MSEHVFPTEHATSPSTSRASVEPLALGGVVTDTAAGVESGEIVLSVVGCGPFALDGEFAGGVSSVGSGEAVLGVPADGAVGVRLGEPPLAMLGWGVTSRMFEGAGVGFSRTSASLAIDAGAAVGSGWGDGALVPS